MGRTINIFYINTKYGTIKENLSVKITKVTNRNIIFTIQEDENSKVNVGLILAKTHNFIIDTGTGKDIAKAVLEYIGEDKKPIIVINTHHDWDHVYGNEIFADKAIIAHKLCRELMDKNWDEQRRSITERNMCFDKEAKKHLPNVLFEGSMSFQDDGITIFHSPFHTEDSVSIYDDVDKVLYTGDNFGAKDKKAYLWGKNLQDCQRMIEKYKQYDFDLCLPSHSEPQGREIIKFLEIALLEAQKLQNDDMVKQP